MYLASIYVSPSLSYVCVFAPFFAPVMAAMAHGGPGGGWTRGGGGGQ